MQSWSIYWFDARGVISGRLLAAVRILVTSLIGEAGTLNGLEEAFVACGPKKVFIGEYSPWTLHDAEADADSVLQGNDAEILLPFDGELVSDFFAFRYCGVTALPNCPSTSTAPLPPVLPFLRRF